MTDHDRQEIEDRIVPVSGLVPMLPVLDVERSVSFYNLLGFAVGNRVPRNGPMQWAWLYAPNVPDWRRGPNLMLTRSECAIDPAGPKILLYLYATNLVALREELLRAGQAPGSILPGLPPERRASTHGPRRVLSHDRPERQRHTVADGAFVRTQDAICPATGKLS